ncbi:MAG: SUF system Fe-S cluster assembly protein [Flavobacteriales bacterium]
MDEKKQIEDRIVSVLKTVYDPEIPVDIFELGLIYDIEVKDEGKVDLTMTLTSPNCPVAESLPEEVRQKTESVHGVNEVDLDLTFEPPWSKDMMSEEAQLELGLM